MSCKKARLLGFFYLILLIMFVVSEFCSII